ncbi:MAG: biopolymer transporter ExbD [Planctomycetota bacterium]
MLIRSQTTTDEAPSVELTPVIDMVFLLLIFFLVATTFQQSEREIQIALPEAEAAGPISASLREIIVNVTGEGEIIVAGTSFDLDSFRAMLADAVQNNPIQKVSVRGDRAVAYGTVARVLDVCKAVGIDEPFLDTVPIGSQ